MSSCPPLPRTLRIKLLEHAWPLARITSVLSPSIICRAPGCQEIYISQPSYELALSSHPSASEAAELALTPIPESESLLALLPQPVSLSRVDRSCVPAGPKHPKDRLSDSPFCCPIHVGLGPPRHTVGAYYTPTLNSTRLFVRMERG